jgi:alginate O-acetyltransferase complex protein AlgI
MVFSSLTFVFIFFPVFFFLYYALRDTKSRNQLIIVFSLLFYAWGEPVYVVIMIISTINDYAFSILIDNVRDKNARMAKLYLVLSIIVNLGLLSFFKYSDFLIMNLNSLLHLKITMLNLPLPIGISFYTFQTMSYTLDVYRKQVKVQKNFNALLAYVTLFPQLIAGPIVRYSTVEDELLNRIIDVDLVAKGLRRFIIGLSKKIIIANQVAILANAAFAMKDGTLNWSFAILGIIAYALQIFYDFSGYSDMAIGMGHMMGFHFLENFNAPYRSTSITDFWRRWHISLGTWFRDYLYFPLGGSRGSKYRTIMNLALVWFLTGLWHGAAWNFIIFGMYYFVILVIEKSGGLSLISKLPRVLRHSYALVLILVGWVIFRSESIAQIGSYLSACVGLGASSLNIIPAKLTYTLPFMGLGILLILPSPKFIQTLNRKLLWIGDLAILMIFLMSTLYLVNQSFNPFIYFRF